MCTVVSALSVCGALQQQAEHLTTIVSRPQWKIPYTEHTVLCALDWGVNGPVSTEASCFLPVGRLGIHALTFTWFLSVCIVAVYGVCLHVFSHFLPWNWATMRYQINHHRHYCVAIVFDPGSEEECQFKIVFPVSSHCWRNGEYIFAQFDPLIEMHD